MKLHNVIDRLASGHLDRREYLELLTATGLGLVTAGAPSIATASSDLLYFTWAGLEDPAFFPSYAAAYGDPESTFYGDEYEGIAKIQAGFEVDVVSPCIDVMPRWMDAGIQPIDENLVTHLPDTFEVLRNPPAAFHNGQRYFVPVFWGVDSMIIRSDLVDIPPEEDTWQLLFDERYAGRMSIWDSTDAVIPTASLAAGFLDDPFRPSGERLDEVAELLRKQRDLVRFYWTNETEMLQAFVAGEIVLAWAYPSAITYLRSEGVPFRWANPKEGKISFSCGLARGNKPNQDTELVHAFINAHLTPEAGKAFVELINWPSASRKALNAVDPQVLADLEIGDPGETLAESHSFEYVPPDLKAQHIDLFEAIKAGD